MSKKRTVALILIAAILSLVMLRDRIVIALMMADEKEPVQVEKLPLPQLDSILVRELTEYVKAHHQTPEEYVVSKFKDHDIVFLGEYHRLKHDAELVQRLIPLLYENGVYNLGMEFACYRDQALIDSLVNARTYDESLARSILFNFRVYWGFQEYADIFRSAWKLNRSAPDSARRFRIVGLNTYTDWSRVKTREDRNNPEIMKKVFVDGDPDDVMARTILKEFVEKNEKALIYTGWHHSFTRYKQPIIDEAEKKFVRFFDGRVGNIVFRAIGDRAFTIALHQPWAGVDGYSSPASYPAGGIIDAFMKQVEPRYRRIGLDTRSTPFGKLVCENSVYNNGYRTLLLEDICDGYVYQKPLSEYEGVTPMRGFINKSNLARAKQQVENPAMKTSMLRFFGSAVWDRVLTRTRIEKSFRKFY